MIFVTVGTQLPFDRLISAVDRFAPRLDEPVFAQIGRSGRPPANIDWAPELVPGQFEECCHAASLIISHAGVGTILAARRHGKPILLVPRRARLREHRSDHQLATCSQLRGQPGIHVALDMPDLEKMLQINPCALAATQDTGQESRAHLLSSLKAYLQDIDSSKRSNRPFSFWTRRWS